ncbi:RtcB family protein [Agrobacterium rubi]|nr:RtcB family protein [Agrobacterium rubi]NTF24617.1 RtcB family protein [Agrobacterium rubi]
MSLHHNPVRRNSASGHSVRSVVAHDEPEHHHLRALQDLASALPTPEAFEAAGAELRQVVTTPDFHPGKPVPVGVVADVVGAVLPHMIGNDIGCGMRMIAVEGVDADHLGPDLERHLRHVFFQGGRDIALTGRDRHAILREGIPGLLESLALKREGLLSKLDLGLAWKDVDRTCDDGQFRSTKVIEGFADYASLDDVHRRDAILGTIGGGNHFVEFGVVDEIADGRFATAAGIRRGTVVIVVHSGSLDFGQHVGSTTRERLTAGRASKADYRILARDDDLYEEYLDGHANAANAAFANRFFIGLAAVEALARAVGREVVSSLVYDAPHNTVWADGDIVRHRKGACTARGVGDLRGSPYEWFGEPVILPGSMGDGSWLLGGTGDDAAMASSAHGAGRKLSRQEARHAGEIDKGIRVVGPVDLSDQRIRSRPDILKEASSRLNEEAPAAYRPIDQVVSPMVDAGLVEKVARIRPLLTVKG